MSKPSAGRYVIYHRVLSPSGEKLAITFNGQSNYATVTPLTNSNSQIWNVRDYNSTTQSVSPVSNSGLQCGWGNGGVVVLPAGGYVWIIRNTDSGYTIQDGGRTAYWGVDEAYEGQNVAIEGGDGGIFQNWIFEQV